MIKNTVKYVSLISIILITQLLCVYTVKAETNIEFLNCNILRKAMEGDFEEYVMIKVVDGNCSEKIYKCSNRIYVNGEMYKNAENIYNAICENSFAKIAIEDGVVKIINFTTHTKKYENVSYNAKKRGFNVLATKELNLPVYYKYNGDFFPAHTDENHLYDIEVSEYGVCITQMKSKTDKAVMKLIEISSTTDADFTQGIIAYCETDASGDYIIKGELYSADGTLIDTNQSTYDELVFSELANETKLYTVRMWLEDRDGTKISSEYVKNITVFEKQVEYKIITAVGISDNLNQEISFKAVDGECNEKIYKCAKPVSINGVMYKDANAIFSVMRDVSFAKIAIEDDIVSVINFSNETVKYENAEYDTVKQSFDIPVANQLTLPVYYKYNDEFVMAYTDENHLYDIEVNKYGIIITQMKSKNKGIIKMIEAGSTINGNFKQVIDVYCESSAPGEYILKGELYNADGTLADTSESTQEELFFDNLDNETKTYKIKLWLEDKEGTKISSEYQKDVMTSKKEVKNTMILQKAMEGDFEEYVMIKVVDGNCSEKIYKCSNRIYVNGEMYKNAENIYNAICENSFAKIAIEDDIVNVINFSNETVKYENAEYNMQKQCFDILDVNQQMLPVYYKYNGDYIAAYTDENHLYDIEVNKYGIIITQMKSKTDKAVINLIDAEPAINHDFNRIVNVYCETDSSDEYILKGVLYNKDSKSVCTAESICYGYGELVFDKLKNVTGEITIKLWLEKKGKEQISSIYIVRKELVENDIEYGEVQLKYEKNDSDKNEVILSIRGIDGTEKTFICNDNTQILREEGLLSLQSIADEINEKSFVKMSVTNGVVEAIIANPETFEMLPVELDYKNGVLSGNVYILNNTGENRGFILYTAIYSADNNLKTAVASKVCIVPGDIACETPQPEGYSYSKGDYAKIFTWSPDNSLMPVLNMVKADILK